VEDEETEELVREVIEFRNSLEHNWPEGCLAQLGVRIAFARTYDADEPPEPDPVTELRAKLRAEAPRSLNTLREIALTESVAGRKAKRYLEQRGLTLPQTEALGTSESAAKPSDSPVTLSPAEQEQLEGIAREMEESGVSVSHFEPISRILKE
jgi:hypothetical protein